MKTKELKELMEHQLKKAFENQLMSFHHYGCPDEALNSFLDLKDEVLSACQELTGGYLLPFLPVLPKPYLELVKTMFKASQDKKLKVEADEYCDGNAYTKPYYAVGISIINSSGIKKPEEFDANFSELISLSLLSGLHGPFFARNSRYLGGDEEREYFEGQSNDGGQGIWLSSDGATGPFFKDEAMYPVIRITKRIHADNII